ncbi:MAG: haloalkane dehalogenase [Bacteroidota bacterium]
MKILRTPEERFENLLDFPYEPKYVVIDDMRIHYVDEGEGEVILALHGEPTWSYLYRKFIPTLSKNYRFICLDFPGFGRSDKPSKVKDYTYELHFGVLIKFIEQLKLKDITLVVQDWGGFLGLGALGEYPDWFKRVVIMNTALPVGEEKMPFVFKLWKLYARYHPTFPIGKVVKMGSYRKDSFTDEVLRAYNAPFPSSKYKAGTRAFPKLVPLKPTDDGVERLKQARKTLSTWTKPALVLFSDKDPIMRPAAKFFKELIPTTKNQPKEMIRKAGHFLQEDAGEEISERIEKFIIENP